jgi:hypothetical protein
MVSNRSRRKSKTSLVARFDGCVMVFVEVVIADNVQAVAAGSEAS